MMAMHLHVKYDLARNNAVVLGHPYGDWIATYM